SSGTASNSFAGSLLVSKGLDAQAIVGTQLTINGNANITGNTTIGDASGDTVTSNADTWTFANDTNLTLSGGVNGFSFDTNTISIDALNNRVGILTTAPSTVFEVQGTASASYFLTGNTIQVGGYSSAAYSRFGTDTTGHASDIDTINDLLISGALEVNGNVFFDGKASISDNFQTAGRFIFGDNGDTGEINTSDWDISNTGALTGISGITNDGSYTQTGTSANALTGLTSFSGGASSSTGFEITTGNLGINAGVTTDTRLEVGGTASISGATTLAGQTYTWPSSQTTNGFLKTDGSGLLSWSTAFSGTIASLSQNFDPATDNQYDLGDPNYRWRTGYFGTSLGINNGNTLDTTLEVGGTASVSGNAFFGSKASISSNLQISGRFIADTAASHSFAGDLTVSKEFVSSGTASNSFAGSLLVSKGLDAQAIVGTQLTINGNANITGNTTIGDAS
ncbi:MAG: hypothetical protein Q7J73_01830, partial [Dehalococcoidales bacterium]|nr:hypothetical protein [Dehalococcoidales bacterium]